MEIIISVIFIGTITILVNNLVVQNNDGQKGKDNFSIEVENKYSKSDWVELDIGHSASSDNNSVNIR